MPQGDGLHLLQASDEEAIEPSISDIGMGPFAGDTPSVNGDALFLAHPLMPGGHAGLLLALAFGLGVCFGGVRLGRDKPAFRTGERAEHLDPLAVLRLDIVLVAIAAVGEQALGPDLVAPLDLFDRRPELTAVGRPVRRLDPDHEAMGHFGLELQIVGRTKAAIGHRHHPRLGIRGRTPRRLAVLGLPAPLLDGFLRPLDFDRRSRLPRRLQALAAVLRLSHSPLQLAPDIARRILIQLRLELRHLLARQIVKLTQPRLASERAGTGARPYPDPIHAETRQIRDPGLHRSMFANGLSTVISGFFGSTPNTTYGENIGVMAITRVYSTWVIGGAAIIAILLSCVGKLAAAIQAIPVPVMGGVSLLLYGVIGASGIRVLIESKVDYSKAQNLILTSVILIIGVSGAKVHIGAAELKGMALATLVGVLLALIFRVISLLRPEEVVLDAEEKGGH